MGQKGQGNVAYDTLDASDTLTLLKKLPKSIRKHIRKEKARIRREVFDIGGQRKLINELYARFAFQEEVETEKQPEEKSKEKKTKKTEIEEKPKEKKKSPSKKEQALRLSSGQAEKKPYKKVKKKSVKTSANPVRKSGALNSITFSRNKKSGLHLSQSSQGAGLSNGVKTRPKKTKKTASN